MAKDIKGLEYNKCLVFQEQIDADHNFVNSVELP
jgi:hypothetical protein